MTPFKIQARQSITGFTIISLMIAILLSSVLMAGLISVFSSNQNASRLMFDFGSLQEGVRTGNEILEVSLRQAGHFGGVKSADITTHDSLAITGSGSCNKNWITDTSTPIRGFDGADAVGSVSGLPSNCIASDEYVAGTDVLSIKYASTMDMTSIGSVDSSSVYIRTIVGSSASTLGEIFKGSDGTTIGDATDPVGTYNYRYASELYYVRTCSHKVDGTCKDDIPSLVRFQLDGTTFTEQLLVEGVEQFQVEFGIDADGNFTADSYLSPASITDWQRVVSVRYSLVVRGNSADKTMLDTKTYTLAGEVNYTPSGDDQAYHRRAYTKVVQLRNMIRG